jgi:hypothetical protein
MPTNIPPLSGRDAASFSVIATPNPSVVPKEQSVKIFISAGLLLAAMVVAGLIIPGGWKLVVVTVAMVLFTIVLGRGLVNRVLGILINERNLMSLSRFQLVVWTVVILSSYLCYGFTRIYAGVPDPLNITIDGQLLLLMGISATSFIAAPLILSSKKDLEPQPMVTTKTALKSGETTQAVEDNREGVIYGNGRVMDARFTDLFQGDELGNATHIDVAKLQLFFFTVIGAVAYFAAVFRELALSAPTSLVALPLLPTGLIMAIGISHGGYLAGKGVSHTPVEK